MSTLTLEVPDDLAELLAKPESRAEAFALLRAHFGTSTGEAAPLRVDAATWALIEEGLDDVAAGRTKPFDKEADLRHMEELKKQLRREQQEQSAA